MREFSCFEILGPVMVGPSSSHTAGAVRLGRLARIIAGGQPKEAKIYLHGSFARTFKGHGTDRALIAGLLGYDTDDIRIRNAQRYAMEKGMEFSIILTNLGENMHPNTVKFEIINGKDELIKITGASTGGGNVLITELNDSEIELKGDLPTLITAHKDIPGVISQVSKVLAENKINIAFMRVFRKEKRKIANMIVETDEIVKSSVLEEILKIESIVNVRFIKPV